MSLYLFHNSLLTSLKTGDRIVLVSENNKIHFYRDERRMLISPTNLSGAVDEYYMPTKEMPMFLEYMSLATGLANIEISSMDQTHRVWLMQKEPV